jgi:hypothetical protein
MLIRNNEDRETAHNKVLKLTSLRTACMIVSSFLVYCTSFHALTGSEWLWVAFLCARFGIEKICTLVLDIYNKNL